MVGIDIDGEITKDQAGVGVGMSSDGKRVIFGAFINDGNGENSGRARVYKE